MWIPCRARKLSRSLWQCGQGTIHAADSEERFTAGYSPVRSTCFPLTSTWKPARDCFLGLNFNQASTISGRQGFLG